MLKPDAVQPMALFIHELAVNAATHGSLSRGAGRVAVSWEADPQSKLLKLTWNENGGPPPPSSRRPGFGTVIADSTIRRQLNGTVEREWSAYGVQVTIEVSGALSV